VRAVVLLHDIGIPRAKEVHGSSAGEFQEREGPPLAETILDELGVQEEAVDRIRDIIANHHGARDENVVATPEFRVVWDADSLSNFPGLHAKATRAEIERNIERTFRTRAGRAKAKELFLPREP
jgi:hypothetical protein